MGREVRRVPLDFEWPLNKVWEGYLTPERLKEADCPDCELGWSPMAQVLYDKWYGKGFTIFRPEDTGSTPLTADTPVVRQFAERNVGRAPGFYGQGEAAVVREAQRLADMWNAQWSHHLEQKDVDALIEADRLRDFTHTWKAGEGWTKIEPAPVITAAMVNEWSIPGMGHDSINAHVVIRAKCERMGLPSVCYTCDGHASVEKYEGQRAEAEKWWEDEHHPPEGDGWQMWETTSEGSPITPVFETPELLAWHCVAEGVSVFGGHGASYDEWYSIITGEQIGVKIAPGVIAI